ncbi:ATP-binding protein [Mycobacteroides abscessus]|uniref:ATP-binding protein n=1 Tax=Mycobacteroides abscessus TaxID=36809 RepID=UPI0009A85CC4|nr:sensor histidine kinase [Mycobacteroides abscessus]RIT44603.1 hypothetical protein D2E80_19735 [Mycobacteroides abscessus]SKT78963.1 histidine kinase [Mycobacteroides abscessus subsp. massiliense]SKU02874.1 histidine kinase [Mycobacteroides abscessus subsp. massiliense]
MAGRFIVDPEAQEAIDAALQDACDELAADPSTIRLDILDQAIPKSKPQEASRCALRYSFFLSSRNVPSSDIERDVYHLAVPVVGIIAKITYQHLMGDNPSNLKLKPQTQTKLGTWIVEIFADDPDLKVDILGRMGNVNAILHRMRAESGAVGALFWVMDPSSQNQTLRLKGASGVKPGVVDIPIGYGVVGNVRGDDPSELANLLAADKIVNPELVRRQGWKYCQVYPLASKGIHVGSVALYYREDLPAERRSDAYGAFRVRICVQQLLTFAVESLRILEIEHFERTLAERANNFAVGITVLGLAHDLKRRTEELVTVANVIADALPSSDADTAALSNTLLRLGIASTGRPEAFTSSLASFRPNARYIGNIISTINKVSDAKPTRRSTIDLGQLIRGIAPVLIALGEQGAKRGDVEFKLKSGMRIWASETEITRILLNLVSNAFAWHARTVTIETRELRPPRDHESRVREAPGRVTMIVSDDGIGMSSADLERCRAAFFTRREGGTGLGLFVVDRVVRDLNGEMRIWSSEGKGTQITMEFQGR